MTNCPQAWEGDNLAAGGLLTVAELDDCVLPAVPSSMPGDLEIKKTSLKLRLISTIHYADGNIVQSDALPCDRCHASLLLKLCIKRFRPEQLLTGEELNAGSTVCQRVLRGTC